MCAMPVFVLLMIPLIAIGGARTTLFPVEPPGAFAHASAIAGKVQYLQRAVRLRAHRRGVRGLGGVRAGVPARVAGAGPQRRRAACAMHQRLDRLGAGVHRRVRADHHAGRVRLARVAGSRLVEHDVRGLRVRGHVRAGDRRRHAGDGRCSRAAQPLRAARRRATQLHDLGKMLFAFSIFWAYIWVCQYLLIWYGNIPEEVGHYVDAHARGLAAAVRARTCWSTGWSRSWGCCPPRAKRNPRRLALIAVVVLAGRWLDLYLVIMPSVWREPRFGLAELAARRRATRALLVAAVSPSRSARAPLVPLNDPDAGRRRGRRPHVVRRHAA